MGLIRKMTSVSTLGAVSYHSPREKVANAARSDARSSAKLRKAEAKLLKQQYKATKKQNG